MAKLWFLSLLAALCCLLTTVSSLGCMRMICEGNEQNEIRDCPDKDNTCGTYKGERHGGRVVLGVDVVCEPGAKVHAPFDGVLYYWRPLGGVPDKDCLDKGGQGLPPDRLRGALQLWKGMCTGQICESNSKNELVGAPFKLDSRYNGVKGWELRCDAMRDTHDSQGNMIDPADVIPRPALIRSPIHGKYIGRTRLRYNDGYEGCDNDGIVIEGAGRWEGYTVRIFNAKLSDQLTTGDSTVQQGDDIGERLDCDGASADSIFVEFLHEGRHIDMTDNIAADSCNAPN